MDLLPRSVEEFRDAQYWDQFFKKRGRDGTFEWYGEYSDLCGVLHKYCKSPHRSLVVGCGNSRLSEDLYDVGYRSLVNIDISDVAIRQMSERNVQRRPDMQFLKMDMRELLFDDGHFDCIVDKATLDAIMAEDTEDISSDVDRIFSEFTRVLKVGGRYVCVSLAQGHILEKLLSHFPRNWFVRVHKVEKQSKPARDGSSSRLALPVFVFVFTKKVSEAMPNILELCLHSEEDRPVRVDSVDKLKAGVRECQNFALLWQRLRSVHPGEEAQFDLWAAAGTSSSSTSNAEPRFSLHVVDSPSARHKSGQFAVFIVPHGREMEWMFSTPAGRLLLAQNASFRRLVVVTLHRGHVYGSLQEIRQEISGNVRELEPDWPQTRGKIPVLSTGEDAGQREVCCTGETELSGRYVVEDILTPTGRWHRRLIFLSNRNAVQSEMRLWRDAPPPSDYSADRPLPPVPRTPEEKPPQTKNQKKKARKAKAKATKVAAAAATTATNTEGEQEEASPKDADSADTPSASSSGEGDATSDGAEAATQSAPVVDTAQPVYESAVAEGDDGEGDVSFLACEHHKAMLCALAVVSGLPRAAEGTEKVLLVGLGGGGLARFMHYFIPSVSLDVVELDPAICGIAKKWFELPTDDRLSLHVADGLDFIRQCSQQDPKPQYSAVMFDVDAKDMTIGLASPPLPFVDAEFLECVKSILAPRGAFILNLVCRNETLQTEILQRVSSIFNTAHALDISNEVNKIIVCLVQPVPCLHTRPDIKLPAMEWVKESGNELEKVVVSRAKPAMWSNVRFFSSLFCKLQHLA